MYKADGSFIPKSEIQKSVRNQKSAQNQTWPPSYLGFIGFKGEPNSSYILNRVLPAQNSTDGNIYYLGIDPLSAGFNDCAIECSKDPTCNGFTWNNDQQGSYANMCYGIKDINKEINTPQANVYSGYRISYPGIPSAPIIHASPQ